MPQERRVQSVRIWLLVWAMSLCPLFVWAQHYSHEVGGQLAMVGYLGDANRRIPFRMPGFGVGVQYRRNFDLRMAVSVKADYALYRGDTRHANTLFPGGQAARFSTHSALAQALFEYNFYPYSDKFAFLATQRLSPYVGVGVAAGAAFGSEGMAFLPGIVGEVGLKYKLASRLNAQLSLGGKHFFSDRLDALSKGSGFLNNPFGVSGLPWKGGDGAVYISLGFSYEFGTHHEQCQRRE